MRSAGRSFQAAVLIVILLLAGLTPAATVAEAAQPLQQAPASRVALTPTPAPEGAQAVQLVFSMGQLAAVDARTVTLTFADGQAETYLLAPETTIQTQNGDAQTVADLDLGAMVVVIAREDDPTALTIVNGGDTGFHEAGPSDIRGHQDECNPGAAANTRNHDSGAEARPAC